MGRLIMILLVFFSFMFCYVPATNKYLKGMNEKAEAKQTEKPFRMMKLNVIYDKASKILTGQKLKNLKNDLKQQDKDEMSLKRLKADNLDKDGLREASVRKSLNAILNKYGLDNLVDQKHFEPHHADEKVEKQLFRDKKLDRLWKKAESSGFSDEELKILKEEFLYHQRKVDEYNDEILLKHEREAEQDRSEMSNHIEMPPHDPVEKEKTSGGSSGEQTLDEKHRELKRSYNELKSRVSGGPGKHIQEKLVKELWDLAQNADFTKEELESLKEELLHFQTRIQKLNHFQAQLENEKLVGKDTINQAQGTRGIKTLQTKVDELDYKVNKLHKELKSRILNRHVEL